jgi:hypothetical protein
VSFLANTKADLTNILALDGESVTHTARDTTETAMTTVIHRTGEEGDGLINIPTASVASPLFNELITDANSDTWRISEVRQAVQGRTPCNLKHTDYWETIDLQEMPTDTETWTNNTTGILAMITAISSNEVISAETGHGITTYEVLSGRASKITSIS